MPEGIGNDGVLDYRSSGFVVARCLLLASCMTVLAAQTGRVLGTGKTGGYMGFGMLSSTTMDSDTGATEKSDKIAMISGIRHGVSETMDLGMRGNSLGHLLQE